MKTYWNGNKAEYTGKTVSIYGGFFYEIKLLEGAHKGESRHIKDGPAFLPCGCSVTKEEVMKNA